MLAVAGTRLGPGIVKRVEGRRLLVDLPGRTVRASLATAHMYEPRPGDAVLTIGEGDDFYVIGVLSGTGLTRLTAPGDLRLEAPNGSIELIGGRRVRVRAPDVALHATRIDLLAKALTERFESARRRVRRWIEVRAGSLRTCLNGDYHLKADRIVERGDAEVHIDGAKINLG